jgi:hypothetical protein
VAVRAIGPTYHSGIRSLLLVLFLFLAFGTLFARTLSSIGLRFHHPRELMANAGNTWQGQRREFLAENPMMNLDILPTEFREIPAEAKIVRISTKDSETKGYQVDFVFQGRVDQLYLFYERLLSEHGFDFSRSGDDPDTIVFTKASLTGFVTKYTSNSVTHGLVYIELTRE